MTSKKVDIKKQPRLGIHKTMSLTINGIRYRLFRSTVTMMVIMVAIAFLMNSLSESLIKRGVAGSSRAKIRRLRLSTTWIARLSGPGSVEDILVSSATMPENAPLYAETMRFAKLDPAAMQGFVAKAKLAVKYLNWFNDLSYDDRRQLVHQAENVDIFDYLQDKNKFDRFEKALGKMMSLRLVTDSDTFRTFLAAWDELEKQVETVRASRTEAIAKVSKARGNKGIVASLCGANKEFGQQIRAAGFELDDDTAEIISAQTNEMVQQRTLEERIGELDVRKEVAKKIDVLPKDVSPTFLWTELLTSRSSAAWTLNLINTHWNLEAGLKDKAIAAQVAKMIAFEGQPEELDNKTALSKIVKNDLADAFLALPEVQKLNVGIKLSPEQALAMAERKEEVKKLIKATVLCADVKGDGFLGLGQRRSWLLLVSIVVCIVGIANAMLMTVTERFREIATLKCLGALDGFIMLMFVFEASILGVIGGFMGSIVGSIIALGRMRFAFGNILWGALAVGELTAACLAAMVMGVLMAAIAAVYPSFSASRMAPMEAMRID